MSKKKQSTGKRTASHIMLFSILAIYVLAAALGIVLTIICMSSGIYESGVQLAIALFSFVGVCGSSTIVVYTNKAQKENEIKIANDKYRMKLDLAKAIYRGMSENSLDDKSVLLLKILTAEDGTIQSADNIDNQSHYTQSNEGSVG